MPDVCAAWARHAERNREASQRRLGANSHASSTRWPPSPSPPVNRATHVMTPMAQMSTGLPWPAFLKISGAMYPGVWNQLGSNTQSSLRKW